MSNGLPFPVRARCSVNGEEPEKEHTRLCYATAAGVGVGICFGTPLVSKIIIQEGGVNLANTPHKAINATSGLTVTNGGSGVALFCSDSFMPLGNSTTSPTAPTTGTKLFSRSRVRRTASQMSPVYANGFQPALWTKKIGLQIGMGYGTVISYLGLNTFTFTGSAVARAIAATNAFTASRRYSYYSGTGANQSAGSRLAAAQFWSGNATGLGGFFFVIRFGVAENTAGYRWWVGMTATTGAMSSTDEPSAMASCIGLGQDSTDTNIQVMYNDASGSCTKVDLGASWPAPTVNVDLFEFRVYVLPNGTKFYWSLENLTTSAITTGDTGVSTNAPFGTLMGIQTWINTGATGAARVALDISQIYIETDY